ncbi:hypothetical protein [Caulobacter endophyticus]|uniref:hypothetical protein n=1 Tax=Caulobacter endophyticus TaxID=2172652 RepID=UPI0011B26050|nr:hypothetical protein [Caulobacter endophyticus]
MGKQASGLRSPDQTEPGTEGPQRPGPKGFKLKAAFCLAASIFTALLSATLLWVRLQPTGPFARAAALILPLPQVQGALADEALAGQPPDFGKALSATRSELDLAPMHVEALLRLAYLEAPTASAPLTPAANAALIEAFRLAPADAKFASWRLNFILERWDSAAPAVRAYALGEMDVLWREAAFRRTMRKRLLSVANPAGQMALSLHIQGLDRRVSAAGQDR